MKIKTAEEYEDIKRNHLLKKGDRFITYCNNCNKQLEEKFCEEIHKKIVNKTLYCRSCATKKVWAKRQDIKDFKIPSFSDKQVNIINNVVYNQDGFPIGKSEKVQLICDKCGNNFERLCKYIPKSFKKFNAFYCKKCIDSIIITEYNVSCIGKNAEARFGEERGKAFRQKMSKVTSGKNNPRYGTEVSEETRQKIKDALVGISYEEKYGIEKANEIKQKLSKTFSGKNNPMYGKPAPSGSGNGWSGWYKGLYFRSLLELSFLIKNSDVKSAEYIKIPYKDYKGDERTYHPDFIKDKTIYEIKPQHLLNAADNKLKFEAAKNYCNINEFKFCIITENDLEKINYDTLVILKNKGELKFIDRYEQKFLEYGENNGL